LGEETNGVSKIKKNGKAAARPITGLTLAQSIYPYLFAVPVFFLICLLASSTAKAMGVVLVLALIAASFLFWERLRVRITLPLVALAAFVLMDGISTQYAIAGKFALYEFLKVLSSLCIAMVLLTAAPEGKERGTRWIATVLATTSAIAALVSIDLLSMHILSDAVLRLLGGFTKDYAGIGGVEAGIRMTSLFTNPNVFAGCAGIGVLLSLGLAASAGNKAERFASCALLYVNSLAFVLAFSMGASLSIAAAFLVYLIFEQRERRSGSLMLMVGTLALTLAASLVISRTSLHSWDGFDAIPLLCTLMGAAALALLDSFVLQRLAGLPIFQGRAVFASVLGLLGVLVVYALAAWNLTGDITLESGETLRRAAYPNAGEYVLQIDADKPLTVMIESQNQVETMMHTSTVLYEGDAVGAAFTVPEKSLVVYFNFSATERSHIQSAAYAGSAGSEKLPLAYKLLPGFISNRLQGLLANENAIQRFVFFSDGLKLFHRSSLAGLGMGCFENAIKSVQSFYYETKYAHNHYIQVLAECGIIGLALFLGVFVVSGTELWRAWRSKGVQAPLLPALASTLVFMALHAAVEVVFSSFPYLPFAFGVIALIGLSCDNGRLSGKVRTLSLLGICVTAAAFAVMTVGNVWAMKTLQANMTFSSLEQAAKMDRFEWADYLLTYVAQSTGAEADDEVRRKAAVYAARLAKTESNSTPILLADYYFRVGDTESAFAMLEQYVSYVASDERAWNNAFHTLEQHDDGTFGAETVKLSGMMDAWNEANIGTVTLDDAARTYLARYL